MKIEKSIVIDAPVEKVFAYFVDPAHAPEYMVGADEVKDIRRLPDGRYTYTIVSKILGFHVDMKDEQFEVIPNEQIVVKMEGAGMDSIMTESVEILGGGKTRASLVAETTFHGGPLAKFGESFLATYMDHGVEMSMEAAKAHIEMGAPVVTPR